MHVALDSHYQILQKSDESDNGEVFKTKGNAFCAAFAAAPLLDAFSA